MNDRIEIMTDKLNSLKVKQAMWVNGGYDCPEYISKEIKELTNNLNMLSSNKDIVEKDLGETEGLTTNQ